MQALCTRIITRPEAERVRASVGHRMLSGFFFGGLYGSFRDGTWLVSPKWNNKERTIEDTTSEVASNSVSNEPTSEIDGDLLIYAGFMSEDVQNQCIHFLEGAPGYVNIDVTEISKSKFEQMFPDGTAAEKDGKRYLLAKPLKKKLSDVKKDFLELEENGEKEQKEEKKIVNFMKLMNPAPEEEEEEEDPLSRASYQVLFQGGLGINIHVDLVMCVGCCGWPRLAASWIKRERKTWPCKSLVDKITSSVFHLVNKPSPSTDADIDIDFRLSFSFAESKLMDTLTGPRLATYMVLKHIFNENDQLKDMNILKTYHLKTVFFWACEKHSEDYWNMEHIEARVLSVLDALIVGFNEGFISHYFIPEINLLQEIQKQDSSETIRELNLVRQSLEINHLLPDPEIEAVAMIELASTKEQYDLAIKQLEKTEDNILNDMTYIGMSWMTECSRYISDCASMVCHLVNKGIIEKNKLWYIEETLSCGCEILSACAEQRTLMEMFSEEEQRAMVFTHLVAQLVDFNGEEESVYAELEREVKETEYTHGYHKQPSSFIYVPYAEILLKLVITALDIKKGIEFILNEIMNPVWSEDNWDLNILLKAAKFFPDFKMSGEGHLSVHHLAQDNVRKLEILYETLIQHVNNGKLSVEGCKGNCWEMRLNSAKDTFFGLNSTIQIFSVISKGETMYYAEGQKLDNLKIFKWQNVRNG